MKREPSAGTGFASAWVDRATHLRADEVALTALRKTAARIVIADGRIVLKGGDPPRALLEPAEADFIGADAKLFLGAEGNRALFAGLTATDPEALKASGHLVIDLRSLALQGFLPPDVVGALGQAKGMLDWHQRHRFCAACGGPSLPDDGGWRRRCEACGAHHFPRTDPVVIMLIHRGERCLLGRKPQFPATMYSCLAGFVEPGETFEDAVRRETMEEVSVAVGRVAYHASQPWPLPFSQLMIGCFAEATSDAIRLADQELADARWFTRDEIAAMRAGTHPDGLTFPTPIAIAHTLLSAWLDGTAPG